MAIFKLWLISILLFLSACAEINSSDEGQGADENGVESTESESTLSGAFATKKVGPELCQQDSKGDFQSKFEKALSCLEAGNSNKSYFLFKRLLQSQNLDQKQIAAINNNLGVILLSRGSTSLGESLLRDSLEKDTSDINSYNFQKLMADHGYLDETDQSYQVVFGLGGGKRIREVKGALAYLSGDLASFKDNFGSIYQSSPQIHLNYLYGLLKFSINEFEKEVEQAAQKFSNDNVMSKLIELKLRTESGF